MTGKNKVPDSASADSAQYRDGQRNPRRSRRRDRAAERARAGRVACLFELDREVAAAFKQWCDDAGIPERTGVELLMRSAVAGRVSPGLLVFSDPTMPRNQVADLTHRILTAQRRAVATRSLSRTKQA